MPIPSQAPRGRRGYKPIGGGRYRNVKPGSARKGKVFTIGKRGEHRYKGGAVIGGRRRRPAAPAYDPLAPLTGKTFEQELAAATQLQYGPQERQLAGERRISGVQQQRIGDWYGQYLQDLDRANQQAQAAYTGAQGAVYGQANLAAQQSERARAALQAQQAQQAQIRGTTPEAAPTQAQQQAAAARQALSSSFGGMLGTLGASQAQYGAGLRTAGAGARLRAHETEAGRGRQIEKLAREIAGEKGAFGVKFRGEQRERERQYALEQKAFGLKTREQLAEEAQERAKERRERRKAKWERRVTRGEIKRERGESERDYRLRIREQELEERKEERLRQKARGGKSEGGGKGAAQFTPTQLRDNRERWREALVAARRNQDPGKIDPLLKQVAWDVAHGGTTPRRARRFKRDYGISVKVKRPGTLDRPVGSRPG